MARIVISYRREDSSAYAGRLKDRLVQDLGEDQVFQDVDSIEPGDDFVAAIDRAITNSEAVIAVIGRAWLTATDENGQRRLDNPVDYVRVEIATALKRGVRLIPVLVGNARMPSREQLPEEIRALTRRSAMAIADDRFHRDVDALVETLTKVIPKAGEREASLPKGKRREAVAEAAASGSPDPAHGSASPDKLAGRYLQAEDLALRAVQTEFEVPLNRQVAHSSGVKFDAAFAKDGRLHVVEVRSVRGPSEREKLRSIFRRVSSAAKEAGGPRTLLIAVLVVERSEETNSTRMQVTEALRALPIDVVVRVYVFNDLRSTFGVSDGDA